MASSRSTEFTVRLDGPIDHAASLEFFRRSGDDLIDRWDGTAFVRTIAIGARPIAYACTFAADHDALIVRVTLEHSLARDAVESVVRSMFVMPPPGFPHLASTDPIVAALHTRYPAVRSVRQPNLFNAVLRCVTTQQVNLRWAATCRRRLAETFGHLHHVADHCVYNLDSGRIANLKVADIRALQITTSKAEYLINVARVLASGELTIAILEELTDDQVIARLTALRGIGVWSAEWILARTLGRPRVVAGDLGVRKAVGIAYPDGAMPPESVSRTLPPPPDHVRRVTAHWGDSAAVVQALLLHALAENSLPNLVANARGFPVRAPTGKA